VDTGGGRDQPIGGIRGKTLVEQLGLDRHINGERNHFQMRERRNCTQPEWPWPETGVNDDPPSPNCAASRHVESHAVLEHEHLRIPFLRYGGAKIIDRLAPSIIAQTKRAEMHRDARARTQRSMSIDGFGR
jgi:hypothetical protein